MGKKNSLGGNMANLYFDVESIEEVDEEKDVVIDIRLEELRPNPYQPRKTFDESALNDLAESIKQNGVFNPIIVRKSRVKGYDITAGERRFRASKLAGKETIPAIVRDYNEEVMINVAIQENLQREDLNPIEEAEAYDMMMTKLTLTQNEVAMRLGKSRSVIANSLRLLSLPVAVKDLVKEGVLNNGQARTILGLKDKSKIVALANKVVSVGMTVRDLEALVIKMNGIKPTEKKPPKTIKPSYIRESEDLLMDKFGTTVVIQDKGDKGKIEIEFVSQSDLMRILEVLDIELDS